MESLGFAADFLNTTTNKLSAVLHVNASDTQADSTSNSSFFYFIHPASAVLKSLPDMFDDWMGSDTS